MANEGLGSGPLYMDFDDNRLLTALFGEHDQNLTRVEEKLNVLVIARGNRLSIQGELSKSFSGQLSF